MPQAAQTRFSQAIRTEYIGPTNFKGSRIKATCDRGSLTISYPSELSGEACHIHAVDRLVAKFVAEDVKKYGSDPATNPWNGLRVAGMLHDGTMAHVYMEGVK